MLIGTTRYLHPVLQGCNFGECVGIGMLMRERVLMLAFDAQVNTHVATVDNVLKPEMDRFYDYHTHHVYAASSTHQHDSGYVLFARPLYTSEGGEGEDGSTTKPFSPRYALTHCIGKAGNCSLYWETDGGGQDIKRYMLSYNNWLRFWKMYLLHPKEIHNK